MALPCCVYFRANGDVAKIVITEDGNFIPHYEPWLYPVVTDTDTFDASTTDTELYPYATLTQNLLPQIDSLYHDLSSTVHTRLGV